MTLVTPAQVNPGDEITADSINEPVNDISTVINGQLSDDNISGVNGSKISNGTISTAKLADGAVTAAKQGDSGWITVTFQNSYAAQNSTTVQYRKVGSVVRLRGQIGKATLDTNVMFTLPSGYRPTQTSIYTVAGAGANYAKLILTTDGTVNQVSATGGTYVGLDTVNFMVD